MHYRNGNSEMLQDKHPLEMKKSASIAGNEETDLRIKNLLSWQNILSNEKIAADVEGK